MQWYVTHLGATLPQGRAAPGALRRVNASSRYAPPTWPSIRQFPGFAATRPARCSFRRHTPSRSAVARRPASPTHPRHRSVRLTGRSASRLGPPRTRTEQRRRHVSAKRFIPGETPGGDDRRPRSGRALSSWELNSHEEETTPPQPSCALCVPQVPPIRSRAGAEGRLGAVADADMNGGAPKMAAYYQAHDPTTRRRVCSDMRGTYQLGVAVVARGQAGPGAPATAAPRPLRPRPTTPALRSVRVRPQPDRTALRPHEPKIYIVTSSQAGR